MAKVCQVTGRKRMVGNNVSHSKRRTKRVFALNLKTKKFWSEEEQRFITLKVSCTYCRENGIVQNSGNRLDDGCRDPHGFAVTDFKELPHGHGFWPMPRSRSSAIIFCSKLSART